MQVTTHLGDGAATRGTPHTAQRSFVPDHGPWLFLAAPFSFGLVVATLVFLARISF